MTPKYRAWYKKGTLPMLTVTLISFDQEFLEAYIDENAKGETETTFDLDEVELMQSTGLVDKNGVEVYEGDICCDEGEFGYDWWTYGYVKWDKEELRWAVEWPAEDIVEPLGGYTYHFGYGNIFENPELVGASE